MDSYSFNTFFGGLLLLIFYLSPSKKRKIKNKLEDKLTEVENLLTKGTIDQEKYKYMRKKGREYQKGYDNWEETVLTHLQSTCKIVELDKTRYTYKNRKNETSRFRVMTFMKQNTNGIYIITTKYHVLCIRYGVLIDRFDSSHYIIQQVHQV